MLSTYANDRLIVEKSKILLADIDTKDIAYMALSMQLDLPLLTRDKPLYKVYKGVRKKGFRKIILFEDFLESL